MTTKTDELRIRFTVDGDGKVKASLASTEAGLRGVDVQASKTAAGVQAMGRALALLPITALTTFAVRSIVDLQKLDAQLVTITQSQSAANRATELIQRVARETGGSIKELGAAWVTLREQGINPTAATLKGIANIAAATGRDLGEVARATAAVGRENYRALQQLGVQVREEGDKLVVQYQGVQSEIANSTTAIIGYIEDIGNVRYADGAARQSATLAGSWSDLTDAATELSDAIGDSGLSGTLAGFIDLLGGSISGVARLIREVQQLKDTAGQGGGAGLGANLRSIGALAGLGTGLVGQTLAGRALAGGGEADEASTLDRLRTAYDNITATAATMTREVVRGAAERQQALDKEIKALDEEIATYGRSQSAVLEYEKAKRLASAGTDAERQTLTRKYDALIALARAEEEATAGAKAAAAAAREQAERLRENERATREAEAAKRDAAQAEAQFKDEVRGLRDALDPAAAALRAFVEEAELLKAALDADEIGVQEYTSGMLKLRAALDDAMLGPRPEDFKAAAAAQVDAYLDTWLRGADTLADGLVEAFRRGFDDIGGMAQEIFAALGEDAVRANVEGNISLPLQQLMQRMQQGGGWNGNNWGTVPSVGGGPPESSAGANNGNLQEVGAGVLQYAATALGTTVGGGGSGAAAGAAIGGALGSYFGPVGGAIGAVLGGVVGGMFDDDPSITARSSNFGNSEGSARSRLGSVFIRTESMTDPSSRELAATIARVDNTIAAMLEGAEIGQARAALSNFSFTGTGSDPGAVIEARVRRVIAAVEPATAAFLNQIADIEERLRAFQAIRALRDQLVELDQVMGTFTSDPLADLRFQLTNLDEAVTETAQALADAIALQDPERVNAAAEAATQAILRRYQAEIRMVEDLEAKIIDIDQRIRDFGVSMAQRIAGVSGNNGAEVITALRGNLATTRGLVGTGRNADQNLRYLDEFIGTVDQWLSASQARISNILSQALAALDREQSGIMAAAQERQSAAQQAAQQAAQAASEAAAIRDQAMRDALQEQIDLAQQWVGVLEGAEALLDELKFSAANPLGARVRYNLLQTESDALFGRLGSAGAGEQPEIATRLLEVLNQQLQLGQQTFQRPGGDWLAEYNRLVRQTAQVRDLAQPQADRAETLQEEANSLQAGTTAAVQAVGDVITFLSAEERARLDAIEVERQAAIAQAEADLAALNAEALGYYQWAQAEGNALQLEQRDLLQAQLDVLTGGLTVDEFIATTQAEARDLLRDIRDDVRGFLLAIGGASGAAIGGTGGSGHGAMPGAPEGPPSIPPGTTLLGVTAVGGKPIVVNFSPVINGTNLDGAQLVDALQKVAPQLATIVQRAAKYA